MAGNSLYDPDQVAVDTRWIQPWSEAFRAQRDVGLRVPINFHTVPAVSLTQACFSDRQYEQVAFRKCFSNLLAVGFRQFMVDTYWDTTRAVWSLCPVELPESHGNDVSAPVQSGQTVSISTEGQTAVVPESTVVRAGSLGFERRQDSSRIVASTSVQVSLTAASPAPSSSPSPTPAAASPSIISYPTTDGPPLLQIGNYNCTSLMTLDLVTGLLADFLKSTATTTGAAITLLSFDVHAAFSRSNPDGPAPLLSSEQLPVSGSLLSDVLYGNLSSDTYTPGRLGAQRANLNDSWYDVSWDNRPLQSYYSDSKDDSNNLFTQDGWPSETFMEFKELYRLVSSYGTIDPQMQYYNIGPDLDFMFPPGTLGGVNTSTDTSGGAAPDCLFTASDTTIKSERNSSWAIAIPPLLNISSNPDLMVPIPSVANLTSCGYSVFLNRTLAGATADKNPLPYAAYVHSTLWTWAPGEPANVTSGSSNTDNRCVVMTTSPYAGRWKVADCANKYHVACQVPSEPYNWQISSATTNYNDADSVCDSNAQFSIPHTALENAHLLAAFQEYRRNAQDDTDILLNFNSLNVPDCWVVGLNGTCPYLSATDTNRTRIVVVPTVAAVVIFLCAVLTFFVKCAANRREDKRGRRRRMVEGWEYEGVPS
ncbi:hypothetical protein T440DRAFT_124853 [Plenodomus tracheiphilus IPT5]|uniref:Maintenance of telomere capping protein 6 n=1 Tax=Plenodomus tracheiphilus IPT5 TaxID=1408161 RepID=A0A6A7B3G6_9PLEO|nr:hypothetical protein T440DRAFT_124853 [Plenodomus tracheiphilus IPT5]